MFLARLLILMVLTSAAASTQTTILPTARTTLSMAAYKALPTVVRQDAPALPHAHGLDDRDGRHLGRCSTSRSTTCRSGNVIADAVTAIGLYIAFYYGLTGFACAWYYRKTLTSSARNLWMQGILPVLGGLIMYVGGGWACGPTGTWRPATATRRG